MRREGIESYGCGLSFRAVASEVSGGQALVASEENEMVPGPYIPAERIEKPALLSQARRIHIERGNLSTTGILMNP